jgi:hypothetical protein
MYCSKLTTQTQIMALAPKLRDSIIEILFDENILRLRIFLETHQTSDLDAVREICMEKIFDRCDSDWNLFWNLLTVLKSGPWKQVKKILAKIKNLHMQNRSGLNLLDFLCSFIKDPVYLLKIFSRIHKLKIYDSAKAKNRWHLAHYLILQKNSSELIREAQRCKLPLNVCDADGHYPIHYAIITKQFETVKQILSRAKYSYESYLILRYFARDYLWVLKILDKWYDKHK